MLGSIVYTAHSDYGKHQQALHMDPYRIWICKLNTMLFAAKC